MKVFLVILLMYILIGITFIAAFIIYRGDKYNGVYYSPPAVLICIFVWPLIIIQAIISYILKVFKKK